MKCIHCGKDQSHYCWSFFGRWLSLTNNPESFKGEYIGYDSITIKATEPNPLEAEYTYIEEPFVREK